MIRSYGIKKEFLLQISCRGLIYQILCYKLFIRKDEEEEIGNEENSLKSLYLFTN
jgi:hypothetical protein